MNQPVHAPVVMEHPKKTKRCKPTRHHVIGRSLRDFFHVDSKHNIVLIEERKHRAMHQFFGQNLTPQSQLLSMFEMYESVLSGKARELMIELTTMHHQDFYRLDIIKKRRNSGEHLLKP